MRRMMFAATAFMLAGAVMATAQDVKPAVQPPAAQPKAVQPGAIQPLPPRPVLVTAARMAQLEEEFETLEANREVRKAHVKAAEIGVRMAEITLERLSRLAANDAVTKEEVERAKLEIDLAKVQVAIRMAELKEVEVKVKFSKKRLDDAKAAGVRPVPPRPVDPKATDPLPPAQFADEKAVEEIKVKLEKIQVAIEKNAVELKKAELEVKLAEAEYAKIKEVARLGRVAAGTFEKAEAKIAEAKSQADKLAKERKALESEAADLQKKLKEIGK